MVCIAFVCCGILYRQVADCCEDGCELAGLITCGKFLTTLATNIVDPHEALRSMKLLS